MDNEELRLTKVARVLRKDIIEMLYKSGWEDPGPMLSCIDIITALYFKVMKVKPEQPDWNNRDRLVLSKGYACPALYGALAKRGYYDKNWIYTFKQMGSKLQGYPDMNKTQGIDMTSGLPGNGLSVGVGMSIALRIQKRDSKVFVILGDEEIKEGLIWEAAITASRLKINNIIAILDYTHLSTCECMDSRFSLEPLEDKWKAFGWRVLELNGHNMVDIVNKLDLAYMDLGKPTIMIAHTIRGKGVSYMERHPSFYYKKLTEELYIQIMKELNDSLKEDF